MNYLDNFKKSLYDIGLDPYIVFNTYVCVGGDGYERSQIIDKKNHKHIAEFRANFGNLNFPEYINKCLCDHHIEENCYISSDFKVYDKILIIGNCCYKRFIKNKQRLCINCESRHEQQNGYCKPCTKIRNSKKRENKKRLNNMHKEYEAELINLFNEYKQNTKKASLTFLEPIDDSELFTEYKKLRFEIKKEEHFNMRLLQEHQKTFTSEKKEYEIKNQLYFINRIMKIHEQNRYYMTISIIHRPEYSILNVFKNKELMVTINLATKKETANSKLIKNGYKYALFCT
jgi:hypothetical protein